VRVLFDTSVLVAAMVEAHPRHSGAAPWLKRAKSGEIEFLTANHSLAELYSILSTLPARPRISPADAWQLVQENVVASAHLIALSPADYSTTLQQAAELGLSGPASTPSPWPTASGLWRCPASMRISSPWAEPTRIQIITADVPAVHPL
jgi:predicted nucleic acid-binding protein